jgi:OOP family OmpA-OmpF porin
MNQPHNSRAGRNLALLLAAASVGLAMSPSVSRAQGAYVGAAAGTARADVTCDLDISCASDDNDTGFKVFAGFEFAPEIAVEVAYVDLGEASISGRDTGFVGAKRFTFETSGANVAAVASLPMSNTFAFNAKAGLFLWNLDATATDATGSSTLSESGTDFMVGLGGTINFAPQVALRLEWEGFFDVGDEFTTGTSDLDFLSAGLLIRF